MSDKDRYEGVRRNIRRSNEIFLIILTLFGAAVAIEYKGDWNEHFQ